MLFIRSETAETRSKWGAFITSVATVYRKGKRRRVVASAFSVNRGAARNSSGNFNREVLGANQELITQIRICVTFVCLNRYKFDFDPGVMRWPILVMRLRRACKLTSDPGVMSRIRCGLSLMLG
jgi:hypothetical protein